MRRAIPGRITQRGRGPGSLQMSAQCAPDYRKKQYPLTQLLINGQIAPTRCPAMGLASTERADSGLSCICSPFGIEPGLLSLFGALQLAREAGPVGQCILDDARDVLHRLPTNFLRRDHLHVVEPDIRIAAMFCRLPTQFTHAPGPAL